jgi:hypothetical protein
MGTYYNAASGTIRLIDNAIFAAWVAAGNPKADGWVLIPDQPSPGATWDGTQWVEPPPPPPVVPREVTMRQARTVLLMTPHPTAGNMLAAVNAALAGIADPVQRGLAELEWEYSSVVQRDRGMVVQLAAGLGLTSQQLDQLFIAAAQIA